MQRLDIYGTPHMGGSLVAYSDAKAELEKLRGALEKVGRLIRANEDEDSLEAMSIIAYMLRESDAS